MDHIGVTKWMLPVLDPSEVVVFSPEIRKKLDARPLARMKENSNKIPGIHLLFDGSLPGHRHSGLTSQFSSQNDFSRGQAILFSSIWFPGRNSYPSYHLEEVHTLCPPPFQRMPLMRCPRIVSSQRCCWCVSRDRLGSSMILPGFAISFFLHEPKRV